jgi:PAS domain S-box-containing protein
MKRDQKQGNEKIPQRSSSRPKPTIAPSNTQSPTEITKIDMPLPLSGSERHYRSLTSTTAQIFWKTKVDGTVDDVPMWRAYTGQTQEEIKGHGWLKAVHADDFKRIYSEWQQALTHGNVFELEYRLLRHDGVYRTFLAHGIPVFENDGSVREWVGASTDITEKKILEDELHESEQRFRATFEQASIGIAHIDLEGHFLLVNQKFCAIAGYTYEELKSSTTNKLLLIDDAEIIAEKAHKLIVGEIQTHSQEMHYVRKDGLLIWVNLTLSLVRDSTGQPAYFLATAEDITSRKQEELRTHDTLNTLLTIAESLVALPDETDTTTSLISSPTYTITRHLTDLTRRVLGCQHIGFLALETQGDRIIPVATAGFSLNEEQKKTIMNLFKQSPVKHTASVYVTRLQANEIVIIDREELLTSLPNPNQTRFTLVAPMIIYDQFVGVLFLDYGREEHHYTDSEISLIKAVAHFAALVIERQRLLTERAEAQAAALAEHEANRRMDEFLSIVSHELRTPLTTINVQVQVANRLLRKSQQQLIEGQRNENSLHTITSLQEMLDSTEHQIEVLNRLINDLIDISRIQTDKMELHIRPQSCDMITLLQEVVANQRRRTPLRTIQLELPSIQQDVTSAKSTPVAVLADPDRITQVIVNYLTNALTYAPPDHPITVYLQILDNRVRISVHDEGPGLSTDEQILIWDRFYQVSHNQLPMYTTSAGMGLGLYISRSLIEQQGGQVGVDSKPGQGSTFWFTLPLAQ